MKKLSILAKRKERERVRLEYEKALAAMPPEERRIVEERNAASLAFIKKEKTDARIKKSRRAFLRASLRKRRTA